MTRQIKYNRNVFLKMLAILTVSVGFCMAAIPKELSETTKQSGMMSLKNELSSINKANGWINSKPLKADDLKGKIVLINFCTYTCINWLRSLPYTRAWWEKYKEQGLVVIAVHTPEFGFEENIENVQKAVKDLHVDFPVAIDNSRAIWLGFNNQYWPALYLIDGKGDIRHHQFGEGGYEVSEKMIQHLLAEANGPKNDSGIVSINPSGIEAAADWKNLGSQENYLGYERTENFISTKEGTFGSSTYNVPTEQALNEWAIAGSWKIGKASIVLNKAGGKIVYRFQARDLHLVMGPAIKGKAVRFRVLIDGKAPGNAHGADVDEKGNGIIMEQRLYNLIRQQGSIKDSLFEIEFLDPGVEAFSFTFG